MTSSNAVRRAVRQALLVSAMTASATVIAPANAQESTTLERVVVTGSRIQRSNDIANSPIAQVTSEQITANADVTLDTMLNTLPQVGPAGTTTSNNPGNGGQSNIDLRGLGANRNVVLIDGRRAMVSASDQTVDLNTIPSSLVESIDVITGGAGATYGADAVSGAVNIKLKKNFEGVQLGFNVSDSEHRDAEEYSANGLFGANFSDGRGNAVIGFEYTKREQLIKSQRDFAAVATATTTFLPEGLYFESGNAPTQAAVDAVFGTYGVAAGAVPTASTLIGFNTDGTLFSRGVFNNALDVQNFRYPIDLAVNTNLHPDVYSYNFDSVNILVLPIERRSFMGRLDYEFDNDVEVYTQFGWTRYTSATALAPTPIPTVTIKAPGENSSIQASSPLIAAGGTISNLLVVPANNPFIPADFATLLASRTGNNANLVGTGATEPFLMRQRTLDAGLRQSNYENDVIQYLVGARGPLPLDGWNWEVYASEGITEIAETQTGNIDTQVLQELLEAADGGVSRCAGGFNPFGRQPISAECLDILEVQSTLVTTFTQRIVQGFVSADLAQLPAGTLSAVLGAEMRYFRYGLDPGSSGGPISGFNSQVPAGGTNKFKDYFLEGLIPILKDAPGARSLEVGFGYRKSDSEFTDTVNQGPSPSSSDDAYKIEVSWAPLDDVRVRASYQRAVRAPNFGELFDGGGSAPQYFDPCSVSSALRTGPNGAQATALCIATGLNPGGAATYVQTPGTQASLETTGNTGLQPESADTMTFGGLWTSSWDESMGRLRASLDYYRIEISDPILTPDPNVVIGACYNYYGTNPTFDVNNVHCQGILRFGGDILAVLDPNDPDGLYPGINAGSVETDGIDLLVDYAIDVGPGQLTAGLNLNYLFSWKLNEGAGLPTIDYAGTANYFGSGLGLSATFPELRANISTAYAIGDYSADLRFRFIDSMDNRAGVQFPGEPTFTGPDSVVYVDIGATWEFMEGSALRIGVNNVLDEEPPTYRPNVQSGTDPSMYDVIGRRVYLQARVKF